MDTSSMDSSGITRLQQQTYLDLKGQDIIIGIIDTGIDYTHPAFRRSDGGTRILRLWDQSGLSQTDGEPSVPAVDYGAAYTGADIDRALESPDPDRSFHWMMWTATGLLLPELPRGARMRQAILPALRRDLRSRW